MNQSPNHSVPKPIFQVVVTLLDNNTFSFGLPSPAMNPIDHCVIAGLLARAAHAIAQIPLQQLQPNHASIAVPHPGQVGKILGE